MRLKSIPEGAKIVCFTNHTQEDAYLTFKGSVGKASREMFVGKGATSIITSDTWQVGFPMEFFPNISIWSNTYVSVEFWK